MTTSQCHHILYNTCAITCGHSKTESGLKTYTRDSLVVEASQFLFASQESKPVSHDNKGEHAFYSQHRDLRDTGVVWNVEEIPGQHVIYSTLFHFISSYR